MNKRLESAREIYLEDKLDFEDYKNVKDESKIKIDILERELQNQKFNQKNCDSMNKLDSVLKILPNFY